MKVDPAEAVRKAKDAVEGLEEPYKMEAFKLVLERLMTQGEPAVESLKGERKPASGTRKKSTPTRAAPRSEKRKSSLSLGVEQLKKLRAFYERFVVKGGELCAFVITNYIREELDQNKFAAPDVEYCYRQLISMKVTVPEIRDMTRALNWLAAASRKKGWLERVDSDHWSISNAGLIAFNGLELAKGKQDVRNG